MGYSGGWSHIFCGSWDIIKGFRAELSHSSMLHLLFLLGSMKFDSSNVWSMHYMRGAVH